MYWAVESGQDKGGRERERERERGGGGGGGGRRNLAMANIGIDEIGRIRLA